jgi:flavin-binding protein dodecin
MRRNATAVGRVTANLVRASSPHPDGIAAIQAAMEPRRRRQVAVTKIIEVVGSSPESSDGAVKAALEDARQTLRNIKAVDVVSTGLRGENLNEWRALVRISFLVERVSE